MFYIVFIYRMPPFGLYPDEPSVQRSPDAWHLFVADSDNTTSG